MGFNPTGVETAGVFHYALAAGGGSRLPIGIAGGVERAGSLLLAVAWLLYKVVYSLAG